MKRAIKIYCKICEKFPRGIEIKIKGDTIFVECKECGTITKLEGFAI